MSSTQRPRSSRQSRAVARSYWTRSRQPLHVLVFLLPLIMLYEVGLLLVLRSDAGVLTNKAHKTLLQFFDAFSIPAISGLYMGGVVIVVVLLVWHLLTRDPWKVDGRTILRMGGESVVLTLPLIVMGLLITQSAISAMAGAGPAGPEADLPESWLARVTIAIGAGLYEELMFRMILVAALHALLVDLGRVSHGAGAAIAVTVSAAAFAWYHPLHDETGQISVQRLIFYFLAGLYFGAIFISRGFGIVVGVHALYDIVMVSIPAES